MDAQLFVASVGVSTRHIVHRALPPPPMLLALEVAP